MRSSASHRFTTYVGAAKRLPPITCRGWDSMIWEVSPTSSLVSTRAHVAKARTLIFSTLDSSMTNGHFGRKQMQRPFSDLIKAMVRYRVSQRGQLIATLRFFVAASRHLEKAFVESHGSQIEELVLRHFEIAETSMVRSLGTHAAYRSAKHLETISVEIDRHQLARRRIGYRCHLRRPPHGDRLDEESQRLGLAKMPSDRALEHLADISNAPADDNERLLLRHTDLLVATGFRIGECLTLPLDCWVEESIPSRGDKGPDLIRCGIRYWPEKGGDPIVKWLPTSAVPLARRAVTEIRELCAPAREVASWLEQNPGRLPCFVGLDPADHLTTPALTKHLGMKPTATAGMLRLYGIKSISQRGKAKVYCVGHVERSLAQRRFDDPLVIRANGHRQMLSESLSVAFVNQFHRDKAAIPWLTVPIPLNQVTSLLGDSDSRVRTGQAPSAFARRDLTDESGNRLRIKTHAFRHWLNTLASRGGLSDVELARWMGRRDMKQNEAYKHGTVEQRTRWARDMIARGSLAGPVARVAHSLQEDEREAFLDAAVEAVHFTPYGVCVHNFAASPCEYHLACFRGCPDYLRHKGNADERRALLRLREDTLVTLNKARLAEAGSDSQQASWVRHAEATLHGLDAALAVDDDDTIDDGARVSVRPTPIMSGGR